MSVGQQWYKLLNEDGSAANGGSGRWSLPAQNEDGTWTPGEWMPEVGRVVLCERGYHLVALEHLLEWCGAALFEAEIAPDAVVVDGNDKIAVSSARLVRRIEAWNERNRRLLACDYAERVLVMFETAYPTDKRPRACIEVARRYANGRATIEELSAARAAAWDASGDAAGAAAGAAAGDAARAAARAAAWGAAWQLARLREVMGL